MTLVVLGLAGFIYAAIQSAVLPALPNFQRSLHTSVDGAGWILITYLLSASVATPIIGRLGDMYGKDRLLVATLARAVRRHAARRAVALDRAALRRPRDPGRQRRHRPAELRHRPRRVAARAASPTSIGIVSSMLGVGGGAGSCSAALIARAPRWQWLFWAPLAPSVLVAVLAFRVIPPSPVRTPARINWTAAVLMSAGMSGVLIAISEAASWGWGSPKTLGLLAGRPRGVRGLDRLGGPQPARRSSTCG